MQCFPSSSGKVALQVLEKQSIDAVILDIMMPEMGSFEFCRRIKTNEKTKDISVLFLTAKMEVADRVKGLEMGGHGFLCKPVEQQELLARTDAAFRVKQLQDELKHLNQVQEFILASHWDNSAPPRQEAMSHAFSRFTPHGHDIGLYLANKVIQNENGHLLLRETTDTSGIVFEFWLPSTFQ
jgi:DNA-binding response OmpR family regulator